MARSTQIIRQILLAIQSPWTAAAPTTRRTRSATPQLDALEGRVVLSHFGFMGAGVPRMSHAMINPEGTASTIANTNTNTNTNTLRSDQAALIGNMASARGGRAGLGFPGRGRGGPIQDAQLTQDLQKLQTDVQSVLSGSTVTDAQRQALGTDLRSLHEAGFRPDKDALAPVVDSLFKSLGDGSYDSDASVAQSIQTSFQGLFTGSTVDQTLIDKTYSDLVTVARNLNISSEELATLDADRAAIKADLVRLGLPTDGKGPKPDSSNADFLFSPPRGFGRLGGGRMRF